MMDTIHRKEQKGEDEAPFAGKLVIIKLKV
jgi:hypothetical protein